MKLNLLPPSLFPITVPMEHYLGDLVCSDKNKKPSITRLAIMCAHANAFAFFIYFNITAPFNPMLWELYLGATIFHAAYDKTAAMIKDFKEKKAKSAGDAVE